MRAPRHFPKDMLFGPVLNAFFGWGVFPGAEIRIGRVAQVSSDSDDGPAIVGVEIEHRGEPHTVLVRVVRQRGELRIANISYDNGTNLADHYRRFVRRR